MAGRLGQFFGGVGQGMKEVAKGKLKEMGEGFLAGATGGTITSFRTPGGGAETGAKEGGKQSPPTGDVGKDTVNAIRDLQSDFNGQNATLKSINSNMAAQLTALDNISRQLNDLTKAVKASGGSGGSGGGLLDFATDALDILGGGKGKGGGKAASKAGGLLRGAGRLAGKAALPLAALMSAYDAYQGWGEAGENFDLEEGQEATFGQKASSAIGGAVSGLTFGLLDKKTVSQGVHGLGTMLGGKQIEEFKPGEKEALIAKQQAEKQAAAVNQSMPEYDIMGNVVGPAFKAAPLPPPTPQPPTEFAGNAFDTDLDFIKYPGTGRSPQTIQATPPVIPQAAAAPTAAVDTPAMLALAAKEQQRKEEAGEEKNVVSFTAKEMVFKADLIKFMQSGATGGGAQQVSRPPATSNEPPPNNALPQIPQVPRELGGTGQSNLPQIPQVPPELGGPRPGGVPAAAAPPATPGAGGGYGAGGGQGSGDQVEQVLATIRKRESGGNYQAQSKSSSASGAYQFIDGTWQSLTKKFGIGGQYTRAADAPKEVQDAVAKAYVQDILQKNGGDVSKVPLVWYTGNAQGKMSAKALAANKGLTAETYQSKWMSDFGQMGGGQQAGGGGAEGASAAGGGGGAAPSGGGGGGGGGIPAAAAPPATPGMGAQSPSAIASQERAAAMPSGPMQAGPTSMSAIASQNRGVQREGQNGMLPESSLVPIGGRHRMSSNAAAAYQKMVQAAQQDGITWSVTDSYRSYAEQVDVARRKGLYSQGGLAATPGKSNHGWGNAVDLGGGANQAGSKQNKWLQENAGRFGFRNIPREPWHWEYTGGGSPGAEPAGKTDVAGGGGGPGGKASQEGAPAGGMAGGAPVATLSGGEQGAMRGAMGAAGGMGGGMGAGGALGAIGGALGGMFGGPLGGMLGGMIGGGVGSLISSMTSGPTTGAQAMQKSFETSSFTPPPSQTNIVTGGSAQQKPSEDTTKPSFDTGEPYISAKDLARIFGVTYS